MKIQTLTKASFHNKIIIKIIIVYDLGNLFTINMNFDLKLNEGPKLEV